MTLTRIAVVAGIALLVAFAVLVMVAGPAGLGAVIIAVLAIAGLVAGGNLLYGRRSHYARVQARMRGTLEEYDRAVAEELAQTQTQNQTQTEARTESQAEARARASEWPGQEPPTDLAGGPGPLP
jgi:C4-dicarboxylate-specific signal transduction histidine kinase